MADNSTWSRLRLGVELRNPLMSELTVPERWCLVAGLLPLVAYSPFKGRLLLSDRAEVNEQAVAGTADVPLKVARSLMAKLRERGALLWDREFGCEYVADLGFYWDRESTGEQRHQRDRYARFASAPGCFSEAQMQARIDFYGGLCWICREVPYEALDHVKPLARGGSNWPANLRPVCQPCNSRKGAKWPFIPELKTAA